MYRSTYFSALFSTIALILVAPSIAAGDLDHWIWRNPIPNHSPEYLPHVLYGITYANGMFVAVGEAGVASLSSDATNWAEIPTATSALLNGIVYASGRYVAVGNGGAVETSSDATNWVLASSGTSDNLRAVVYGNGTYVAVGSGGTIITSTDSTNWVSRASGSTGSFASVTHGNAGFVAVDGSDNVFYSADGVVWTNYLFTTGSSSLGAKMQHATLTFANNVFYLASYRVATSLSYDVYIFSSADGLNWVTNRHSLVNSGGFAFIYNFFVVGGGNIFAAGSLDSPFLHESSDGISWNTVNNAPYPSVQTTCGSYGNGVYVIMAKPSLLNLITLPPIYTSSDGVAWANRQFVSGPTNRLASIASTNGIYVAGMPEFSGVVRSGNGMAYTQTGLSPGPSPDSIITFGGGFIGVGRGETIYHSVDGLGWIQGTTPGSENLHSIAASSGLLVAIGEHGTILTSPTGDSWTSRASGTSLGLFGVTHGGGLFVVVGEQGEVLTSADGINWAGQVALTASKYVAITYGSAGFVAVGPGGTIASSPDGTNWTLQSTSTTDTFQTVTFGNGYYLAAGDNELVMTSLDGEAWAPRSVDAAGQSLYGSAFINGRFTLVGAQGTIIESGPITPAFAVLIHPKGDRLTVAAPVGSSFRIQTTTNLLSPTWVDAASFTNVSALTQWTNTAGGLPRCYYRAVAP